ncbi:MAG: tripartite tricarboxylate transporter TctB family protein [Sporichthyaceae bacterium]|nr:tripartite tricarboxylate transporter TctB family protein [Sporichthyaceae bacterium]
MASPQNEVDATARRGLRPRSDADLIAGLVFVAFGVAFGVASLGYTIGSLREMGSGYAPLLFALVLTGLGIGAIVKAYVSPDTHHPGELPPEDGSVGLGFERVHWRPIVFVVAALLFFALTVDGLGLLPATFGTSAIAAFAGKGMAPFRALLIAVGLTVGCYVVFVLLLQLRLPLLGEWLG